jgi:molecular chaperone GrpE
MQSSRASEHDREQARPRVDHQSGVERRPAPDSQPRDGEAHEPAPTDQGAEERRLREELARTDDRYKRALADLENYRKRSERETERRVADAREALERDWLEALDSVERALRMTPDDLGLQAVLSQMESILSRHGVQRLGAAGERFDPERHEAISVRTSGGVPDQTILEVARSGFTLGERVLRPAQVIVSRASEVDG